MTTSPRFKFAVSGVLAIVAASAIFVGCGKSGGEDPSTGPVASGTAGSGTSPNLKGKIEIDGSTTVYPISQALAEDFHGDNKDVDISVGQSGTGSGMSKFERGELDIAGASRPIEQKEADACKAAKIDFVEIPIATDGVCIIVNSQNKFADKLTLDELKKAFTKGSTVKTWADLHAGWPADPIVFYGPTSNHGTFDYFTETICGKKGNQRDDVTQNQDYTALITAIAGDKNALGYVGFSYYEEKKDQCKALAIDSGKGPITPSLDTVKDNSYTPLSRPLFLYVNKKALDRPEIKAFLKYAFTTGKKVIPEQNYVLLPDEAYAIDQKLVDSGKTGSVFMGAAGGASTLDILKKAQ
jgi:phosphate transport system substrate-binding protein